MEQGKEQIYGTQGSSYGLNSDNPTSFIWPIKDPENVNKLRLEAGFLDTVEENAKRIFGDDFEFRNYTIEEVNKIIASYK